MSLTSLVKFVFGRSAERKSKKSLYRLLVAETIVQTIWHDPQDEKGNYVEAKSSELKELYRAGRVFSHSFISVYEQASGLLWTLGVAEPVRLVKGQWHSGYDDRGFPAFFRLRHDIRRSTNIAAIYSEYSFPSLNYVLRTYLDLVWESEHWRSQIEPIIDALGARVDLEQIQALTDSPSTARSLPVVLVKQAPAIAQLLERLGYLEREQGFPGWTETARPALGGNWFDLQGGPVESENGRPMPRLRSLN
ncbi:MAG: hypothetical protein EOS70_05905 [Mesorhizobium sp.]|uniref:hypothetical protein n=1 Tax=Mesorhizobium sp. TaxID=1871066 RepID=UPI000FE9E138|nr:hypothetical protein [Mesorhizobium sp.]RWC35977.1 MAG: hypothetical protein EOS70_05905 [Mesorhizobium sp.]